MPASKKKRIKTPVTNAALLRKILRRQQREKSAGGKRDCEIPVDAGDLITILERLSAETEETLHRINGKTKAAVPTEAAVPTTRPASAKPAAASPKASPKAGFATEAAPKAAIQKAFKPEPKIVEPPTQEVLSAWSASRSAASSAASSGDASRASSPGIYVDTSKAPPPRPTALPPPPRPPPRPNDAPGPKGAAGTRRPRPRGKGGNANTMWHKALWKAKDQGHAMHFMFRYTYPKPGDLNEYRHFRKHIDKIGMPTEEELDDESYEMLMPSRWRKPAFATCENMEQFWKAKYKQDIQALNESQRWRRQAEAWGW